MDVSRTFKQLDGCYKNIQVVRWMYQEHLSN